MKKHILPIAVAMIILLAGCSSGASGAAGTAASEAAAPATAAAADASVTEAAATIAAAADAETTAAATPAVELVLPLAENTSGKVMIQNASGSLTYQYNSYIITSAEGESAAVDPKSMPRIDVG